MMNPPNPAVSFIILGFILVWWQAGFLVALGVTCFYISAVMVVINES